MMDLIDEYYGTAHDIPRTGIPRGTTAVAIVDRMLLRVQVIDDNPDPDDNLSW